MQAGVLIVGGAVFVLFGFVLLGGPMILTDWSRKRRAQVIARQIALTDALDGRLGAIVAPVVKKPLLGLWEVQIAVPFLRSAAVARILSIVGEVFSDTEGNGSSSYRVVLRVKQDAPRETRRRRTRRSVKPWTEGPVAAA